MINDIELRTKKFLKNLNGNLSLIKHNNPEKYISKISVEYDLLITGTPKKNDWASILFGTGKDKFVENASCSVFETYNKKLNQIFGHFVLNSLLHSLMH